MRNWLNNYFYDIAFNEKCKESISTADVSNDNSLGPSLGETNTKDKVFILHHLDLKKYPLPNSFTATDYAIAKGALANCIIDSESKSYGYWWWTRPEGAYTSSDLEDCYGGNFEYTGGCVRPVCWIEI